MPLQLLQCIVDEDPPVLPVGQFSEKFVHFITQCMRKLPKERPAPNNLMDHPFIVQYNDGNTEVVSMWVCRSLEDRKAQQPQRLMWTTLTLQGVMGDGVHIPSLYSSTEKQQLTYRAPPPPMLEFNGARWDYASILQMRILTVYIGFHWCKSSALFFCSLFFFK